MADVRELLEGAAPTPSEGVDPERLWAAGRRRRTGRRVGAVGGGALAATLVAVLAVVGLPAGDRLPDIADTPDGAPSGGTAEGTVTRVEVSVDVEPAGVVQVTSSDLRVRGDGWEHDVTIRNLTDAPISISDTRWVQRLRGSRTGDELLAAGPGCEWEMPSGDGRPTEVCNANRRNRELGPREGATDTVKVRRSEVAARDDVGPTPDTYVLEQGLGVGQPGQPPNESDLVVTLTYRVTAGPTPPSPTADLAPALPAGWQEVVVAEASFGVPGGWDVVATTREQALQCRQGNQVRVVSADAEGVAQLDRCRGEFAAAVDVTTGRMSGIVMEELLADADSARRTTVNGLDVLRTDTADASLPPHEYVGLRVPTLDAWLAITEAQVDPELVEAIVATLTRAGVDREGTASPVDETANGPGRDCPDGGPDANPAVDFVAFLQHGGRQYLRVEGESGLTVDDLGSQVGQVVCRYDRLDLEAYGDPRDGDAAYLESGTPVFALPTMPEAFRLAVLDGDEVLLYEVASATPGDAVGMAERLVGLATRTTHR